MIIDEFKKEIWGSLAEETQNSRQESGALKISIATALVFMLSAVLWIDVLELPAPWKVTNPLDPRFDAKQFRFTDYSPGSADLGCALKVLLPVGTNKVKVDEILVDHAGAKIEPLNFKRADASAKNADGSPVIKQISGYEYKYSNLRSALFTGLSGGMDDVSWEVFLTFDENGNLTKEIPSNCQHFKSELRRQGN